MSKILSESHRLAMTPTRGSVLRLQTGSTSGGLATYEAATPARAHYVARATPVEVFGQSHRARQG